MSITPTILDPDEFISDDLGVAASTFAEIRPRLKSIAARILRDHSEADDIVQDAWLRWQFCDRASVRSPAAFLVTTTTHLAINSINSARARHEYYVGVWFTEPSDQRDDPAAGPERNEVLERGVRVILERLSPVERAAYVLRHAFDYPYESIASILQLSEANARQIVSRAGKRIQSEGYRCVNAGDEQRFLDLFVGAARRGQVAELEQLFAA